MLSCSDKIKSACEKKKLHLSLPSQWSIVYELNASKTLIIRCYKLLLFKVYFLFFFRLAQFWLRKEYGKHRCSPHEFSFAAILSWDIHWTIEFYWPRSLIKTMFIYRLSNTVLYVIGWRKRRLSFYS